MRKRKAKRVEQYEHPVYLDAQARLAETLLKLRHDRGWTQATASERCEMDFTHYGNLERRRHNPTLVTLARLAVGFEVDIEVFLRSVHKNV